MWSFMIEDFLARDNAGIASLHQLEARQRKLLDDYWKEKQWSKKEKRSYIRNILDLSNKKILLKIIYIHTNN